MKTSSFSVIVSFIAVALLGCALLPLLPVKLVPSQVLPGITVSFSMPGSSARTVESEVTSRLESMLARVTGVKHIKSRSSSGYGSVTVELDRNADTETARFETAMIVRQMWGEMPENAGYPQIRMRQVNDDAARPFMIYTVNADENAARIMAYAEENLRPALSRLPGVAKVELSGATPMEWAIEYDSRAAVKLGITTAMIQHAVNQYYGSQYLGLVRPYASDSITRLRLSLAPAPRESQEELDLSKIILTNRDGQVVALDKIARAAHRESAPQGYFRINGLNSIYLNITATEEANQIDLSAQVRRVLGSVQLPPKYMLNLSYDASESITKELDTIYFRTMLTVVILLVFVALITLSWRYLLLITISLTINMAVAVVAYYFLRVEIQLYSLAGITISLNLVIDNLIVMTEHIIRRHNLRAFSAVLAATLTTVGALSVVFFLDEETMLSLKDFVIVVIVNLSVSLLVALLLVPALAVRMRVAKRPRRQPRQGARLYRLRRAMGRVGGWITRGYQASILFLTRHKAITYTVFILAFGLPVFMLPEKVEGDGRWARIYNSTIGTPTYKEKVRPWVDVCLGGTLRLFVDKVIDGRYYNRGAGEPVLSVNATLPNGSTLGQMNALISKLEAFLVQEKGIRQFQTSVSGPRRASISIYFKPEEQRTGYPYRLKSDIISKVTTLGGGSWSVYGLEDQGFSNDVRESAGSYRVKVRGYNYDDLYGYAEALRDTLLTRRRIKEVTINSEFSWWKDDYTEFFLAIDKERLARDSLSVSDVYRAISNELGRDIQVAAITTDNGSEAVRISADGRDRDVWGFMNIPLLLDGRREVKLADYASIERRQAPPSVVKEDQEYVLCIQYEYIGSNKQGEKVLDGILKQFNASMPIGYRGEKTSGWVWMGGEKSGQYWLLLLIVAIIFFVSAILFNSLRQPLAIIFVIPVSFIGVFLTFYLFKLKFDQGGFAAFILLCGITVNAAIYIVNEYNALRQRFPGVALKKLYFKAFSIKIVAVMLTVLSTVLGFIPFLIGDTQQGFWYPLAAGTMGGLIFSLTAIFILLPLFILPREPRKKRPR